MIAFFFIQSFLTLIIFMILLLNSDYSGGYTGMTPLTVLFAISIQLFISIIIYLLFRNSLKKINKILFLIIHIFIYQFTFLIFSYNMPILNIFEDGFTGFINRCYSFSSILSGIFILSFYLLKFNLIKLKR